MACGRPRWADAGRELGWHFRDLDDDIELQQQMKISDIFDTLGEEAFRAMRPRP